MTSSSKPDKIATLLFLIKDNQILLAEKKRGFGKGKWNGSGGKLQGNETIEEAAIRETQEEIGVIPLNVTYKAIINFFYPQNDPSEWWETHVYTSTSWKNEPTESEEMRPQWFTFEEIPYQYMWPDDTFWLPELLKGNKFTADFTFNHKVEILHHNITVTS
jgi:8-oxo-dGTP diphosphatase